MLKLHNKGSVWVRVPSVYFNLKFYFACLQNEVFYCILLSFACSMFTVEAKPVWVKTFFAVKSIDIKVGLQPCPSLHFLCVFEFDTIASGLQGEKSPVPLSLDKKN